MGIEETDGKVLTLTRHLEDQAKEVGFPSERLRLICDHLLPHYVRCDRMARRYRFFYAWTGTVIYLLAAAAVTVAAFQAIFREKDPGFLWWEVGIMLAILVLVLLGIGFKWHDNWIDQRFLAERFRSALFMAVAGIDISQSPAPRHLRSAHGPKDWMVRKFSNVWKGTPRYQPPAQGGLEAARRFLVSAWLDDQIDYHQNAATRYELLYHVLMVGGIGLFVLTAVAAWVHAANWVPRGFDAEVFHNGVSLGNIVMPAVAGAIAAIRTHREYHRNARRSHEMVRQLEILKAMLMDTEKPGQFAELVAEVEKTMLHENQDWLVMFRFHPLELSA